MAIKPKETTSSVVALRPADQLPTTLRDDFSQYEGAGTSDKKEDNLVPFIYIAQKGTPQVDERDPAYVAGLVPGMLFNTATKRFWTAEKEPGPLLIQAHFERAQIEWVPRNSGGGFIAKHPVNTPLLQEAHEELRPNSKRGTVMILPNGNHLIPTCYHYFIMVDTLEPVVMGMASTQMQSSRTLNTMLRNKKIRAGDGRLIIPPSFATVLSIRTHFNQNELGTWFTASFKDEGWVSEQHMDAYEFAKEFHHSALVDGVKTQQPMGDDQVERMPLESNNLVDDSPL